MYERWVSVLPCFSDKGRCQIISKQFINTTSVSWFKQPAGCSPKLIVWQELSNQRPITTFYKNKVKWNTVACGWVVRAISHWLSLSHVQNRLCTGFKKKLFWFTRHGMGTRVSSELGKVKAVRRKSDNPAQLHRGTSRLSNSHFPTRPSAKWQILPILGIS